MRAVAAMGRLMTKAGAEVVEVPIWAELNAAPGVQEVLARARPSQLHGNRLRSPLPWLFFLPLTPDAITVSVRNEAPKTAHSVKRLHLAPLDFEASH